MKINKLFLILFIILLGTISTGTTFAAIGSFTDSITLVTPDGTTSPTFVIGQTGVIGWEHKVAANGGQYTLGIQGGSDAIKIKQLGTSIKEINLLADTIMNKDNALLSVRTPDATTSPILEFGQVGAVGWQYSLESGTGALIVSLDGGQDAIKIKRSGLSVFQTIFPNGNVGIGTTSPAEKLDVSGNIRLTGNIVSPNDICIGTCS